MGQLLLSTILVPVNNKQIGLQLKKARMEAGLSQEKVSEKIGVTWEMISRYENGRSSPLKHLQKFAQIYNKPISYFIEDQKEANEKTKFSIKDLANELREEGIGYQSSLKNVVKLIDRLSGKGIEDDIEDSDTYYEAPFWITKKYPQSFALKLENIEMIHNENKKDNNNNKNKNDFDITFDIEKSAIGFFSSKIPPKKDDIVIAYNGIAYKLMQYDPESLDAPLAVLISTERRFRE